MIRLKKVLVDEINLQAETEYPFECCGLLLGKLETDQSKTVESVMPISNAREAKDRHNRFLITPAEMMRGESFARKNKLEMLGFYHSHPDHPAAPSGYDLEHAWPFYSYIIASVAKGRAGEFTSWVLENDRTRFISESIIKGE